MNNLRFKWTSDWPKAQGPTASLVWCGAIMMPSQKEGVGGTQRGNQRAQLADCWGVNYGAAWQCPAQNLEEQVQRARFPSF